MNSATRQTLTKIVVPLALAMASLAGASGAAPSVAGLWKTQGDDGLIRIDPCGPSICGRIASASDPSAPTDSHNPNPALRDRAREGMVILKLSPIGPDRWGDGWIYNPDNGKSYRASIALAGNGRLRLRGCLVFPLCRTQTWTRADRLAGTAAPPRW
jgi:uncharacterized protein (DUF2147 family)